MKKFFDSVDQDVLLKILSLRIKDSTTFNLLKEVITSYTSVPEIKVGMPIGNLTSQIFANIYLNELDRFVKHRLKPKAYVRYGDDFIVIEPDLEKLKSFRIQTTHFLNNELKVEVNPKSDRIVKSVHGLRFLGMVLWPYGNKLNRRNIRRVYHKLNASNISSYGGLIKKHGKYKDVKRFNWLVQEKVLTLDESSNVSLRGVEF